MRYQRNDFLGTSWLISRLQLVAFPSMFSLVDIAHVAWMDIQSELHTP